MDSDSGRRSGQQENIRRPRKCFIHNTDNLIPVKKKKAHIPAHAPSIRLLSELHFLRFTVLLLYLSPSSFSKCLQTRAPVPSLEKATTANLQLPIVWSPWPASYGVYRAEELCVSGSGSNPHSDKRQSFPPEQHTC